MSDPGGAKTAWLGFRGAIDSQGASRIAAAQTGLHRQLRLPGVGGAL